MRQDPRSQGRLPAVAKVARFTAGSILVLSTAGAEARPGSIGLSGLRSQVFFNEEIGGFPPQSGEWFGRSAAAGDFNGDGALDLATGIPFDNGPTDVPLSLAGAVVVRWGSAGGGLSATSGPTLLSLYAAGGQEQAHAGDLFGYALAAGDFDGDGRDDLAVGIPRYSGTEPGETAVGAVQIHYGEPGGIQLAGGHFFSTVLDLPFDPPGGGDHLGYALAAGDFDGDSYDDLAMGAPYAANGGGVVVLHGGVLGLRPIVGYLIHQDDPQVPDDGEAPDEFGYALAAGNFNGDFRCINSFCRALDDLAISAPGEDGVGAVMVIPGNENDLIFASAIYLGQGDLSDVSEAGDRFGDSLAAGNFDGDFNCFGIFCFSYDDLAIGAPLEDLGIVNERVDAGEVTVLYGAATGFFNFSRTALLWQGFLTGNSADDESGDEFGFAVAAGDFDRDGRDDLAIGQPGENSSQGGATVVMGGALGFDGRHRFVTSGAGGVVPGPQSDAKMGWALAAGDFNGNGYEDLAITIPYRDQFGLVNSGAESIFYGALFADGFESGSSIYWSACGPAPVC